MFFCFPVSLKLTFEQFCWVFINLNLNKIPIISVNFEGEKMVDHILEIPELPVFSVTCFKGDTTIFSL